MKRIVLILICLLAVVPCQAQTLVVDGGTYKTITSAIADATDGDVIVVHPGTYEEQVNFIGKAITITSTDPCDPEIVASTIIFVDIGNAVIFEFDEGHNSVLTGFTVTGGYKSDPNTLGFGINCNNSSPTITRNKINGCIGAGIEGIDRLLGMSAPYIAFNDINDNTGPGIDKCYGEIIDNNIAANGGGIYNSGGPITGNIIFNNSQAGYGLSNCIGPITHNEIRGNGQGMTDCTGPFINNQIEGNIGGGLKNCTGEFSDCNIIFNGTGLDTCGGPILNCDITNNGGFGLKNCTGPVSDCNITNNIGFGLTNSTGPISDCNISGNGGDGIDNCTGAITDNLINGNSGYGIINCPNDIIFKNSISGNSKDGLRQCSSSISKNIITNNNGAGVNLCVDVNSNIISGNKGGGLISCNGIIIDNNIIDNNAILGGGLYKCSGDIINNVISGNNASGNFVLGPDPCDPDVNDPNIIVLSLTTGYGGGLYQCDGNIVGNVITGNKAQHGGGIYEGNGSLIMNNVIVGNKVLGDFVFGLKPMDPNDSNVPADSNDPNDPNATPPTPPDITIFLGWDNMGTGGGLSKSKGDIINNTIASNWAGYIGGGIYECNNVLIKNNIIVFNHAPFGGAIYSNNVSSFNCYDCDPCDSGCSNFGGGTIKGPNDFIANPLFAKQGQWATTDPNHDPNVPAEPNDPNAYWVDGDYHLKSQAGRWDPNTQSWIKDSVTSLCIDAGDPCDGYENEPLPNGDRINLGAYGNTEEASKSIKPVCLGEIEGDVTGDCKVDFRDFALTATNWLMESELVISVSTKKSQYNGPANGDDSAVGIIGDGAGNIYVTGTSEGNDTGTDIVTIKYDATGRMLWAAVYDGNSNQNDTASAIAKDPTGAVYVTGYTKTANLGLDYVTIKYDPNGRQAWASKYNGSGNSDDYGKAIVVDSNEGVYVTGNSKGTNGKFDYATIKYNGTTGSQVWATRYNGTFNGQDYGRAIALDSSGNVYVTGGSESATNNSDYATIKYNRTTGSPMWVKTYNKLPINGYDFATAVVVDHSDNICVTGFSCGSGLTEDYYDYLTVKYNSSGTELWSKRYDGSARGMDVATALAVDNSNNIYVTGYSKLSSVNYDYTTIKYSPSNTQLWIKQYDGTAHRLNYAQAIATDDMNNVYVTGKSQNSSGKYDLATMRYDSDGNLIWANIITAANGAFGNAIFVESSDNIYVAGTSIAEPNGADYLVAKYSQNEGCNPAVKGDINHDCSADFLDIAILAEHWLECGLSPEEACWPDNSN